MISCAAKNNSKNIYDMLVDEYDFEGFMHETNIKNVYKILNCGMLKSRNALSSFKDSADKDVLKHTEAKVFENARFYFFKRTPTNYRFDENDPNNMVYIVFKWDIIYIKDAKIANGNAASEYTKIKLANDYFNHPGDFMDWDSITSRSALPSFPPIKYDIIRKRNAELIIPKGVSTDYIDKIVFKSEIELNKFKKELNNDILLMKYKNKIKVDSSYFY